MINYKKKYLKYKLKYLKLKGGSLEILDSNTVDNICKYLTLTEQKNLAITNSTLNKEHHKSFTISIPFTINYPSFNNDENIIKVLHKFTNGYTIKSILYNNNQNNKNVNIGVLEQNTNVTIELYPEKITNENIHQIVGQWINRSTRNNIETNYGHISEWNVRNVRSMNDMFYNAISFNNNIKIVCLKPLVWIN